MPEQNSEGNPSRKSTLVAGIAAGLSLVSLIIGWLVLRELFYGGSHSTGTTLLAIIFGAWALGIFAGVLALNVVYSFGVNAEAKIIIVDLAVAGLALNTLSIAAFLLLIYGLGKIR